MKVFIQHWDAVELFCLVVSKFKGQSIKLYYDNKTLDSALSYYSVIENGQRLSQDTIGTVNTISNVVRMIRMREPIVITKNEYDRFIEYLSPLEGVPIQKLETVWEPKYKTTLLRGRWWFYCYDNIDQSPGITRSVLYLNAFSKAALDSLKTITGAKQRYTGSYHMYGDQATYMMLMMRIDELKANDLHALFYMGSERPELALGQYHNVEISIYSGTAIIEPALKRGPLVAKFFPFREKNNHSNEINDHIWAYFEKKRLNTLRVPAGIVNEKKLEIWLDNKKANRDKLDD